MKHEIDHILITGKKNHGKTHFTKWLIPQLIDPVIIIDPMNEYADISDHVHSGFLELSQSIKENKGIKKGVHCLKVLTRKDALFALRMLAKIQKKVTIVLEEADKWCAPNSVNKDVLEMTDTGAHFGISLLFVARRTGRIDINLRAQTTFKVTFKQTEPADLATLDKELEDSKIVAQLNKYEFLVYGDHIPNRFKKLTLNKVSKL